MIRRDDGTDLDRTGSERGPHPVPVAPPPIARSAPSSPLGPGPAAADVIVPRDGAAGDGGATPGSGPVGHPLVGRPVVRLAVLVLAVAVVVAAMVAGARVAWQSSQPAVGPSTAPGSPPDPAAIAARVDRALVDVDAMDSDLGVESAGTGIVLTADGTVLTNNHVVEGATSIEVTDIANGRTYPATVAGYDRSADVALLRLRCASRLATVAPALSTVVRTGEGVVVVGNAGGVSGTPTYAGGSVTATDRTIVASDDLNGTSEVLSGLIETNAAVIPGDSGGALADSAGHVIGMVTAGTLVFRVLHGSGSGFAIPLARAVAVARAITAGRSSATVHVGPTAFLGVDVQEPVSGSGAEIAGLVAGGPAQGAGLLPGDTITSLGGHPVASPEALTDLLVVDRPGTRVAVRYVDPLGTRRTVELRLGSGPPQ